MSMPPSSSPRPCASPSSPAAASPASWMSGRFARSRTKAYSAPLPGGPFTKASSISGRRRPRRTSSLQSRNRSRGEKQSQAAAVRPRLPRPCRMLAKRIIPCLDVNAGRVVKGVNFVELRDAGDPVEIARRYDEQGADELTFLDITATSDQRDLILPIIEAVASQVFIPLTVGGGVRAVEDVRRLLNAGADKVSMNSSAVANPQLVRDSTDKYGSQCIVVAIDAKRVSADGETPRWEVFTHGGRK